jgi:hypothetical protein
MKFLLVYILFFNLNSYAQSTNLVKNIDVQDLITKNNFLSYKGKPISRLLGDLKLSPEALWDEAGAFNYAVKRYKISDEIELFVEIGLEGDDETVISAKINKHVDKKLGFRLLDKKLWKLVGHSPQ